MTTPAKSTLRRDLLLLIGLPLTLSIGLFATCFGGESFAGASDLLRLSQALMTEFREPGVGVAVDGSGVMTLSLSDASFAELDATQRADRASSMARYAVSHWKGTAPISAVAIKFTSTSGVPGFTVTHTETPYRFTATELRSAVPDIGIAPVDSVREVCLNCSVPAGPPR